MREKKPRIFVTFPSTASAMEMEQNCLRDHISGRLVPVPAGVRAGCGLAWMCEPREEESIRNYLHKNGIQFEQISSFNF